LNIDALRQRSHGVIAALLTAAALALPTLALGHGLRTYHAVAPGGQYLNVAISSGGAAIPSARMRERCRPGSRHQLVQPNFLADNPIAVDRNGRFARTIGGGGSKTRYRGFVNGNSVVMKVTDSADAKCDGGAQRFLARLIK